MAIKVIIPSDKTKVIANSLFQWDYGQMLEITASEMGSEVCAVHFACSGMSEAIVRPCSFTSGVGTVQIPDRCLEQTSPVTAWIYRTHDTTGYTWKAIEIPVITRIRPSYEEDVPQEVYNQYTELISEVNEAIDNLENGTVVVASATNAATAAHATTADRATVATTATAAESCPSLQNGLATGEVVPASATYAGTSDNTYAVFATRGSLSDTGKGVVVTSTGLYVLTFVSSQGNTYTSNIAVFNRAEIICTAFAYDGEEFHIEYKDNLITVLDAKSTQPNPLATITSAYRISVSFI